MYIIHMHIFSTVYYAVMKLVKYSKLTIPLLVEGNRRASFRDAGIWRIRYSFKIHSCSRMQLTRRTRATTISERLLYISWMFSSCIEH